MLQGLIGSPRWDDGHLAGAILLAVVLVGVPLALVLFHYERAPGWAKLALPLVAAIARVALGRGVQEDYISDRDTAEVAPPLAGGFRSSEAWYPLQEWGKEQEDQRIAVVGRGAAIGP